MTETVRKGYQYRLEEQSVEFKVYRIDPGAWIWPEHGYHGGCKLETSVTTDRKKSKHFGFTYLFTTREPATILFKGNHFTLHPGTSFRTWAKNSHPIKMGVK